MRLLLILGAVTISLLSVAQVGAASTMLGRHDRQLVVRLSTQLKAIERATPAIASAEKGALLTTLRTCSTSSRDKSVTDSVVFAAAVLNTAFRMRVQIHSTYAFIRAQTFNNKLLADWLGSVKKAVTMGEQAGVLTHPVKGSRFCGILSQINRLLLTKSGAQVHIPDKVDELAGVNMRLVRAAAATRDERNAMSEVVVPLFETAGLSTADASDLANL